MRTRIPAAEADGDNPDPRSAPRVMGRGRARPSGRMPLATAALLLAALGSCDSDPVVEPVAALEIVPDSVTLTHIGQQFAFSVRGGGGAGAGQVRWRSTDAKVFVADANGSVTATGNGAARVMAQNLSWTDEALVRVRQVAAVLEPFGDGQQVARGLSLLDPLGVRVTDAGGTPATGVTVRFEVGLGGGSVAPGEVRSDSTGLAEVEWTLGPTPGRQTLHAVSGDGTASVEIAATALEPDNAVASFEVLAGEDQWAWSGRALAESIVVRAQDEGGRSMPAATIRFEPDKGGRADPETAVSDSAGVVSTVWTLGTDDGLQTLEVSTGGEAAAQVTATARDPDEAVASVTVLSGEEQWAVAGHSLPDSVIVRVTDGMDRPVWGATVRFDPDEGSGRADPETAVTDGLGLASSAWTLGPELGAQRLEVRAGAGLVVPFGATAVSDEGVCNRTPAVSAEVVERLVSFVHIQVSDCAEITDEMLGRIDLLNLSRKGIRRLRSGDFAGLVALEVLYLADNELVELPAGVFDGLSRLRSLALGRNQLAELPPGLLANLDQLQDLGLPDNLLSELPRDTFRDLSRLTYLDLASNELTRLPPDIFEGLSSLEKLFLSRNRPAGLPEDLFDGLSNLELLTLRGNELTSLPEGVFSGLSRLSDLRIGDNRLTELAVDLLWETPNLQRLDLERNELTELPRDLLLKTPALQRLFLRENRLTLLPPGVFDRLPNLIRLDLADNDLAELPSGIFAGTPMLAELSIEHNELAKLPPRLFAGLSELQWVTLNGNPGAPFPVRSEFVRIDGDLLAPGPAQVALRVPTGAPFAFSVPFSVQRGMVSRDAVSLLSGDTISTAFEVSATSDGGAVHLGFLLLPEVRAVGYQGLKLTRAEELVLFAEANDRSPLARSPIPAHRLQAGGPSADLVLAEYFDDPDGDALAYAVETAESGVVAMRMEEGVLWLDPMSPGTTEIEVTATDPGGLRAIQRFRTWVVPAPDPDAFNIELYFEPGFTPEEKAAIRRAADRWMEAVTGDLPDVPVQGLVADYCYGEASNVRLVGVVDDVLIRMRLVSRLGGNVAVASTCSRRESGRGLIATNSFALWYARERREGTEGLYRSALHEIGHVLGFGRWIYSAAPPAWRALFRDGGVDGHFAGPLAVAAFDAAGGVAYPGGKVPLEDGIPVLNIHWRKRVIPDDIMAPGGGSLLTAITIQALADLGYEVDLSKADPYTLPGPTQGDAGGDAPEVAGTGVEVPTDAVIEVPVVVVDRNGKVVRIIRR